MVRQTEGRLSREAVADGALALADAEGLEAVTIRRLAQELGVTPMALYWHFKNKDELLTGVAGRVWGMVDPTRHPELAPLEQFRNLLSSFLDVLRRHRAAVPLLGTPGKVTPEESFPVTELALEILDALGFPPDEAAAICIHALRTVTGLVVGEPGGSDPQVSPEEAAEEMRRKRITLETLPRTRFPCIIGAAGPLTSCDDPQTYYDFGIELFVAGVAALSRTKV
jgi:TetR/AcrR family tetracycline transcriptional repressor